MPKLKTKKSIAKRFRFTKKGKIKRWHPCKSHLLTGKSRKKKRHLRQSALVSPAELRVLKQLMPYGE